jgi:hypothetical protein
MWLQYDDSAVLLWLQDDGSTVAELRWQYDLQHDSSVVRTIHSTIGAQ